jgi:hypothetical protein
MFGMSDDEEEDEEAGGWVDWFEEALGMWIGIAVIGASVAVPIGLWIATEYFGWEPPEFIQEWIDFFAA